MLEIGNKKFRNLQEQVGYNTEQINNILEILDGLNIQDNVIAIADLSHILTQDELEIVNRAVAFIVYNDQLFIKRDQDATNAYFDIIFSISGTTVISFNSDEIQVNLTTGVLTLVTNTFSTYSKTELDSQLGAKANTSYVNAQLALKANLSGANFTGAITAPSIIEDMSGYSWQAVATTGVTIEPIYVGVCKNGNKLSFVFCSYITKTSADAASIIVGVISMPQSVLSKLYPAYVGMYEWLDVKIVNGFETSINTVQIPFRTGKLAYGTSIQANVDNAVVNTKYFVRYEVTFLLSDNLAS